MKDTSEVKCAKIMRALGDPERLRIVANLRDGPKNVTTLTRLLDSSMVMVSHNLQVLRRAGVVDSEKEGRTVTYRLHPDIHTLPVTPDLTLDFGCCRIAFPPPATDSATTMQHDRTDHFPNR